jgi:flagellar protein FliO/FliZ
MKIGILSISLLVTIFLALTQAGAETLDSSAPNTLAEEAGLPSPSVTALTVNSATPEDKIPVQLEAPKKTAVEGSSSYKAIVGLAILGILAAGGYLLVGKYRRSQLVKNTAPEIKVLRQHYLGPKKSLAIIRVAGESILIGVTDNNINLIKSLSLLDEDVPEETPQNFAQVLQNDEDFAISGIKDFVGERLKGMRKLN